MCRERHKVHNIHILIKPDLVKNDHCMSFALTVRSNSQHCLFLCFDLRDCFLATKTKTKPS